jgi:hypothetical protein
MHVLAGSFFVAVLIFGIGLMGVMLRSHGDRMMKALAGQTGLPQSSAVIVDLREYRMRAVTRFDDLMPLESLPLAA